MSATRPAPMRMTSVPPARASASQSVSRVPLAGSSCPVTIVTLVETPRCVTGMPAYAGAAIALVTPGTTSNGTCAAMHASRLLAAATEHERIAALEPHYRLAFAPVRHEHVVDLLLVHRGATGRLPNVDPLGRGGREVEERGRRQAVVDDDIGTAQQFFAAACEESRVAGSGADEVHGHGATPSASSRARPPRCSSRSVAAARPTSSATRP